MSEFFDQQHWDGMQRPERGSVPFMEVIKLAWSLLGTGHPVTNERAAPQSSYGGKIQLLVLVLHARRAAVATHRWDSRFKVIAILSKSLAVTVPI
jgi:hypothetical protein